MDLPVLLDLYNSFEPMFTTLQTCQDGEYTYAALHEKTDKNSTFIFVPW